MPQTVYMQRHWRHDHGFTSPDPRLTKELGIPNACNRCHPDRNSDWALKYCQDWYGSKMERPARDRARTIDEGRKVNPAARIGLLDMLRTNELPYWRAVAGGLLGTWADEPPIQNELRLGLNDSEALVRIQCVRALESVSEAPGAKEALTHLLNDPVLAVRLAATWALRSKLDLSNKAGQELLRSLKFNSDQPAGQMQLGALNLAQGTPAQAMEHYRRAVEWDPSSPVAHHDYAVVLSGLNHGREAVEQLQMASRLEPTNAVLQYELGLGWSELGQTQKAIERLQESVRLDAGDARAWYNLGLAFNATGQSEQALEALRHAETADRADPRIPYAQATILARLGKIDEARKAAQRVLEIEPGSAAAHELLSNLGVNKAVPKL